jgi:hypothetical protein
MAREKEKAIRLLNYIKHGDEKLVMNLKQTNLFDGES